MTTLWREGELASFEDVPVTLQVSPCRQGAKTTAAGPDSATSPPLIQSCERSSTGSHQQREKSTSTQLYPFNSPMKEEPYKHMKLKGRAGLQPQSVRFPSRCSETSVPSTAKYIGDADLSG